MKENFSKKDTNIIKGIAILFLMFHHCFLSGDRYRNLQVVFSPFSESIVNYIAAFLKICVPIFVFLTAYGITISLKKQYQLSKLKYDNISEYVKHRFFYLCFYSVKYLDLFTTDFQSRYMGKIFKE